MLANEAGISEGLPETLAQFKGKAREQKSQVNIKNVVDIFVLLANEETLVH